jgi:hypothetical protein
MRSTVYIQYCAWCMVSGYECKDGGILKALEEHEDIFEDIL